MSKSLCTFAGEKERGNIYLLRKIYFMKIVIDNRIPFIKGVFEPCAEVVYLESKEINNKTIKNADAIIIRTRTICNETLLKDTKVKFIGTATIGYDHIDEAYCEAKDIKWTNAPGCNSMSVAEYITSVLITFSEKYNFNLEDKTLGIIGVGQVGKKVERCARLLNMKVLLNDPPRAREEGEKNFVSLEEIADFCDIITIHTNLEKEGPDKTYHIIDEEFFSKIKKPVFFINAARGSVMNTDALKKAIKDGKVTDCAIDCWENEPEIDKDLLYRSFITTPHIAGYSIDGKINATRHIVKSLIDFFNLDIQKEIHTEYDNISNTLKIPHKEKNKINTAILSVYNPLLDTNKLKEYPEKFDELRNNYELRKDYRFFKVTNVKEKNYDILRAMGFHNPYVKAHNDINI